MQRSPVWEFVAFSLFLLHSHNYRRTLTHTQNLCGAIIKGDCGMYAEERQQHIEGQLAEAGRVAVIELARTFDVSSETVRRDLDQLEARGVLRRVHGGAVSAARVSRIEESVAQRTDRNSDA